MSKDEVGLDALLAEQAAWSGRAIIEAIPDKPDMVKVTPLTPTLRARCGIDVTVPKSAIKRVKKLDKTVRCCGHHIQAVEIEFANEKMLTYADLLHALSDHHDSMIRGVGEAVMRMAANMSREAGGGKGSPVATPLHYGNCMVNALLDGGESWRYDLCEFLEPTDAIDSIV